MKLRVIFVLCFIFLEPIQPFNLKVTKCRTKKNSKGYCREQIECVGSKELLTTESCPTSYVCCPVREVTRKKCYEYSEAVFGTHSVQPVDSHGKGEEVKVDECGITAVPLIVGGTKAAPMEFPHMAALGLRENPNSKILWQCGGSLISELYILTAAHCINKRNNLKNYLLKLGAVNVVKSTDAKHVEERNVEEVIVHPRYHGFKAVVNDIALLKMDKKVTFTKYVRPLCLDYKGAFSEERSIAIGHGLTAYNEDSSPDLLKVILDIIEKNKCEKVWKRTYKRGLPDSILCAGYDEPGRDTCSGDSGGPLQVILAQPYCMYKLLALTSKGSVACGSKHSFNLYTRVFWFLPWIESVVWPGED